jgi:P-aminobenzoate N-oxygenase AurF
MLTHSNAAFLLVPGRRCVPLPQVAPDRQTVTPPCGTGEVAMTAALRTRLHERQTLLAGHTSRSSVLLPRTSPARQTLDKPKPGVPGGFLRRQGTAPSTAERAREQGETQCIQNAWRLPRQREQNGTPLPPSASQARALLHRLANNWGRRACVKQPELEGETLFDASKDGFVPHLLPFRDHPAFLAAPEGMRTQILSCGWLDVHFVNPSPVFCLDKAGDCGHPQRRKIAVLPDSRQG